MSQAADSAGIPFAGREFRAHPFEGDDGSAPESLKRALEQWNQSRDSSAMADVVNALRDARVLVPLLADAGDVGVTPEGRTVEKTQELSVVSVQGPDGQPVAVAFSNVQSMTDWRPEARPVPIEASKVALWAVDERMAKLVIDPSGPHQCVLRRGALRALLLGESYIAPWLDAEVTAAIRAGLTGVAESDSRVDSGWQLAHSDGPDLLVTVTLAPGMGTDRLRALQQEWATAWSADATLNQKVDGIRLRILPK